MSVVTRLIFNHTACEGRNAELGTELTVLASARIANRRTPNIRPQARQIVTLRKRALLGNATRG